MFEPATGDRANLQSKVPQQTPQGEFQGDEALLHSLTSAKQGANFLGRDRFAVNWPEPAEVKQTGDTFGVSPIRLDRHGLQGALHLPGFHQHDTLSGLGQPAMKPLRQGTSREPNSGDASILLTDPA